jgi:nicotinic acid mononucleotide adenylyltransferase
MTDQAQQQTTPAEGVTEPAKSTIQEVNIDGYSFKIDTDRIDDVEILDTIDAIENQKKLKEIITFLEFLIGKDGYNSLKDYFVKKDGKFKLSKLFEVYQAIFEKFDPKG